MTNDKPTTENSSTTEGMTNSSTTSPTPAKEDLGDTLMWTRRIRIATDEERAAELLRSLLLRERQRILEGLPQQVPHIGWPTQAHRDYLMGYNNALAEVGKVLNES